MSKIPSTPSCRLQYRSRNTTAAVERPDDGSEIILVQFVYEPPPVTAVGTVLPPSPLSKSLSPRFEVEGSGSGSFLAGPHTLRSKSNDVCWCWCLKAVTMPRWQILVVDTDLSNFQARKYVYPERFASRSLVRVGFRSPRKFSEFCLLEKEASRTSNAQSLTDKTPSRYCAKFPKTGKMAFDEIRGHSPP